MRPEPPAFAPAQPSLTRTELERRTRKRSKQAGLKIAAQRAQVRNSAVEYYSVHESRQYFSNPTGTSCTEPKVCDKRHNNCIYRANTTVLVFIVVHSGSCLPSAVRGRILFALASTATISGKKVARIRVAALPMPSALH